MRRAGLAVALAFAAFASAEEATPYAAATTALVEGQPADVMTAMQNILVQTEGTVPSTVKIGGDANPLGFSISNQAGEDAIVLVIPELKVAAAKPDASKPATLGCYTIGDDVAKVALLMCENKDAAATPVEKDGKQFEWVKGTITNEGTEAICQLKFASNDLKLASLPALETVPADLAKLTPFKLEPAETVEYAFLLPIDALKEGVAPTVGLQDSLGPCKMIEMAKEALAAATTAGEGATGALADAGEALATATGGATDAIAMTKKTAGEAAAATKAALEGAADATTTAAGDAATAAEAAATTVTEAVGQVPKLEVDPAAALPKVGDVIKLNGEEVEAATTASEVTSPAPKVGASVVGLFTVAVLVAAQLLL